jgi:hypothetical protein
MLKVLSVDIHEFGQQVELVGDVGIVDGHGAKI